jgi:outer membrane protein TolC
MSTFIHQVRRCFALTGLSTTLLLGACVQLSEDSGESRLAADARVRLGARVAVQRSAEPAASVALEIDGLLAAPLGVDDAVQLALLNNRGLQAVFADLRIAEADLVQAGRLANPRFSTVRTSSADSFKNETAFTFPILGVLMIPAALGMERRRYDAVVLQTGDRILQLAAQTRRAWVDAVATDVGAAYFGRAEEAALAVSELAERMRQAGNFSRLQSLREQSFQAGVVLEAGRARAAAAAARERFARLLGVGDAAAIRLPDHLPPLPAAPEPLAGLEAFALSRRLDLVAVRGQTQATAASLGLVRLTRVVNALELGPATLMEDGHPLKKGYEISVEVPLFDWGGSRVARAEAIYLQALHRVAETAVNARTEVREAYARYAAAWELARGHRDRIVPMREAIAREQLLRFNGMLASVFELMADAREQIAAAQGYAEALREFWLAEADLRQALGGRLPPAPASASTAMSVQGG